MIELSDGTFSIGTDDPGYPDDGEGPAHLVHVDAFAIGETTVTVAEFAAFVEATGFRTDAEQFGWSFVFAGLLPDDHPDTRGVQETPWWRQVFGADWAHPEGPESNVEDRADHPVVHVSWQDAMAYCTWGRLRLPTEAEWEYAATDGGQPTRYWWGDELEPGGTHMMNIWQGAFPERNDVLDGYYGTAPVRSFPPNRYGLHETTGNVWEWTADVFNVSRAPAEPQPTGDIAPLVMKGGSYLCHESYCHRYRPAARAANTPDTSTGHLGFRVARSMSSSAQRV